jgi:PAS domain S-box-containing protein
MLPDFRVRQRDYLLEIARALTEELNVDALLGRILTISIEMLAGQAGLIALRDESQKWRVAASQGIHPAFLSYLEPWLTRMADRQSADEDVISEINRLLKNLTHTASLGLLTGVGLPLVARKQVIGVIFVFRSYPDLFSRDDRLLLSSFANQAAIAVSNAQLYSQVSQQKQRLDALLDSAADGILILTADNSVERANPVFSAMVGMPLSSILNHRHDEIIYWEHQPQDLTLDAAEAGGWPLTPNAHLYVEGDLRRSGQLPLPVGVTYAPLLSPEGTLLNIIVTVRDITHFRQAEELKSTFISVISHELKTPVALIKGYVGTLRRDDATWDRSVVEDSLQVIEEEADHLTELIENLLDASRLQAGGFAIKRSDVSLLDLANRVVARMQVQTKRHQVIVDIPADLPIILADETRLQQVLTNLVSNAIKYSPGGEIRISARVKPEQILVCVSDQGPGIAAGDMPHVFDRFYRGPDASRSTKGTGLGLYLARAIIEAHGGRIWVDPRHDEGARICFSLPR